MWPCSIPHLTACLPGTAGIARLWSWVAVSRLSLPLPKVAQFLIPALQIEKQRNYKRVYRTMRSKAAAKAEKPLLFPPCHPWLGSGVQWELLGKSNLNRGTISWLSCSLCEWGIWYKALLVSAQGGLTFEIIKFKWSYSFSHWGK